DGKSLLTGHWNHRIVRWDVASGKEAKEFDLPRTWDLSTTNFPTFLFTEDSKRVACGYSLRLEILDVASGKEVGRRLPAGYWRMQEESSHSLLAITPYGRLACTGQDGSTHGKQGLRLWDMRDGKLVRAWNLPGEDVSYASAAHFVDRGRTLLVLNPT